ncbi:chemotaxis protein CheW [Azospirillum agricola]|uniref:chemotaxis protein CheW n=1 Tax=Azospirillum agricola TaxID=1720247 RepID=UPI000A0F0C20|nr:CheW domain-containing protein [Azospirillum agricola]SMH46609.1 purine-binding chemotaxis protein CheW [Azospirillum lipoferum]
MAALSPETVQSLLIGTGETLCAVPLMSVVETMRPMAIERLQGCPDFVAGLSVIRGVPTPVVVLSALLGRPAGTMAAPSMATGDVRRFVTLRTGGQDDQGGVALAVERVIGVRRLEARSLTTAPPLLAGMPMDVVGRLGTLDGALLMVLEATRLLPATLRTPAALPASGMPEPRNTDALPS